uniref:Uncharacterized protein n=1 Tax=Chenopodium quinoa TaxID=63459 RepID=A0A803NDA7_CHEQI
MRALRKRRINCHCTKDKGISKLNPNHSYKPLGSVPVAALRSGLKDKRNRMIDSDNKKGSLCFRRDDEAENIPISLNLNNVKREAKVSPIRTNPPTPQGSQPLVILSRPHLQREQSLSSWYGSKFF